jgi:hypothetical protein
MKTLSEKEKEIIRLIQKKEITDILSFIKYYNLGTEICFHDSDIIEEFNKVFKGKEYIIHHNQDKSIFLDKRCIIEDIDKNTSKCKPYLSFAQCKYQELCANETISFRYDLYKPIYICENMDRILQFIAVWQYLENERLVIELPKSCEKEDFSLFLSKENIKLPEVTINEENLNLESMKVFADSFMDWKLTLNKTNFELCYPYLCKKIYPTLALDTFIEKDFKTKSDIIENHNFMIALVGVIVAIATSLASLFISLSDQDYTHELNDINDSLKNIYTELNTEKKSQSETSVSANELLPK